MAINKKKRISKKEKKLLEKIGKADEYIVLKIYNEMMEKGLTHPQWLKQTEEGKKFLNDIMIHQRTLKEPQTEEQIIEGLNEAFYESLKLHKIKFTND